METTRDHGRRRDALRPIGVAIACAALQVVAHGQTCATTRVSVDTAGVEGDRACGFTALSASGRFVAFTTAATNLVPNDTNDTDDVFVHDRVTGVTERVSVSSNGVQGNASSSYPSISPDGRYVAFSSWAATLVPNDTNNVNDVFLRDRFLGTTERVSLDAQGNQGDNGSYFGMLAPDARWISFLSFATNLVPGDTNDQRDVFVRDLQTGATERVSVSSSGAQGDAFSGGSLGAPFVTSGGRFVVFTSSATNLVAGDTNGFDDVFLRDRELSTTTRLALGLLGVQPDDDVSVCSISMDGRFAGILSNATNLVSNDANGTVDAFVVALATGAIERVSVATGGVEGTGNSWVPVLSADGRFAAFMSSSTDLIGFDVNGKRDVFVRDRLAGTTERVSVGDMMQPTTEDCSGVSISADGSTVAFTTPSPVLVPADSNDVADVFVRECRAAVAFCFGTAGACPCGNAGFSDAGCANSITPGARLTTEGVAAVSGDTLTLVATELPPATVVLFLQGATPLGGGFGVALGDGLRCVGGQTVRLGQRAATAGTARFGFGSDPYLSVAGQVPIGGDYRHYQAWYRNSAAFCTVSTFNFSNGATVLWIP